MRSVTIGMHRRREPACRASSVILRTGRVPPRAPRRAPRAIRIWFPAGATIQVKQYLAAGYVQAMHELCIGCHTQVAREKGKPDFARCATCHKETRGLTDATDTAAQPGVGRGILLPVISK